MIFNILDYGADKSGRVNSACAIQKAIDDCTVKREAEFMCQPADFCLVF